VKPSRARTAPRADSLRWNHNSQYGRELLDAISPQAVDALDVGCGEGWLVRELRGVVDHVVGIDPDAASVAIARSYGEGEGVGYLVDDFLVHPFAPASFDVVVSVASLHHMDEESALGRMAELLRPGGTLGVVGLARTCSASDFGWDIAGAVATRAHKLTKHHWETPAPRTWPPPHTYREIESLSRRVLPGCRFRRRPLFRYVVTWTKALS
jgi:SAM-dependent methyltransferase